MPNEDATTELNTSSTHATSSDTTPQPLLPAAEPGRLIPPVQAASLAFLGVMALGSVLLLALKFQYPGLGAGADVVDILTAVVVLSLAILRVPIHLGELTLTILPLGALFCVFLIVRWACRVATPSAPATRGPAVGGAFSAMALLAALIFRFRFKPDALYAGAIGAATMGFLWVTLFWSLVFATSRHSLATLAGRRLAASKARRPALFEGLRTGLLMLLLGVVLGTAAALVWAIFVLLTGGGPRALGFGDLVASVVYLVAFAPNLVVIVLALSLGAFVDIGAALTVHGGVRGNVRQLSVIGEGAGGSALLLLVPAVACLAGGFWARRNTRRPDQVILILTTAALTFASTLAVLAWLGQARLGAELAAARGGFALVAPQVPTVFLLAALWAAVAGYAGWMMAERRG